VTKILFRRRHPMNLKERVLAKYKLVAITHKLYEHELETSGEEPEESAPALSRCPKTPESEIPEQDEQMN